MPLNLHTNSVATSTQKHLRASSIALKDSMNKLSSGSNINSAKDDAAGLQISNRLQTQSRGLEVALRNSNDAISTLEVADGALNEYTNILFKVRDLSLQSLNGSLDKNDKEAIRNEITQLGKELTRIAQTTEFAGKSLFTGHSSYDHSMTFQVGSDSGQAITATLPVLSWIQEVAITRTSHDTSSLAIGSNFEIPSDWRTETGDFIEFIYSPQKNGQTSLRVDFESGKSAEDIIHTLNSALEGGEAKFFLAEEINSKGESVHKIGYSREYDPFASVKPILGIASQNFQSMPSNNLIYTTNPWLLGEYGAISYDQLISFKPDVATKFNNHYENALVHATDQMLAKVDSYRSGIGATNNRLENAINNLTSQNINTTESKSRIKDTDFAKETTELTKQKILNDSTTSILAQTQNIPKSVSQLLA
ncbi:flagellin [Vibrio sp. CAU 1672]|uniref:flagellin N-terminal helical domain-containing protein n=1 Tax=Vibrio sp. CAU 1672 TaxID=3032594 RepID=UPI0023DA27A4|nr:flagellin [Vibrio sp. CAU 1672]MDF2154145.1 flagellin [Vibrio sp. CAU 1672]